MRDNLSQLFGEPMRTLQDLNRYRKRLAVRVHQGLLDRAA
jgi:hypothetical protein